jgi:hypothetical protein
MPIESIVTIFVVGFVAVAVYGHVLVAQALLSRRTNREAPCDKVSDNNVTPAADVHLGRSGGWAFLGHGPVTLERQRSIQSARHQRL